MSDPEADGQEQAGEPSGEATADAVALDSTPVADSADAQGDQSSQKRINGLMSLANQRLTERDQALAEIESLRAQLDDATRAEQSSMQGQSQIEAMYPERFVEPSVDAEGGDPMAPPEPPVIRVGVNPARPDYAARPSAATPASSPAARFAQDQAEIAAMKTRLNAAGQQWFEAQREQGLLD